MYSFPTLHYIFHLKKTGKKLTIMCGATRYVKACLDQFRVITPIDIILLIRGGGGDTGADSGF